MLYNFTHHNTPFTNLATSLAFIDTACRKMLVAIVEQCDIISQLLMMQSQILIPDYCACISTYTESNSFNMNINARRTKTITSLKNEPCARTYDSN